MSEMPHDIRRAAMTCYKALPVVYDGWDEGAAVEEIARAILAERERCARIAESCCWDFPEDKREAVQIETCDVIARAIRTPSTGEET